MLRRNSSSAAQPIVSLFLNKSKKSYEKATTWAVMHNGVVRTTHSQDSFWLEFRLVSNTGGLPVQFISSEHGQLDIDATKFQSLLVGEDLDVKFKVDVPDEVAHAISEGKCLKLSFKLDSLVDLGEKEIPGHETKTTFVGIQTPNFEVLDYYYGLGKKINPDEILDCLLEAASEGSQYVSSSELKSRSEKNKNKKEQKRMEALARQAQVQRDVIESAFVGIQETECLDSLLANLVQ